MFLVVTLAFIPLFISIMVKLKINYERLYSRVKCKLITVFTTYISFLCLRLMLFADIKLFNFFFDKISIYEAIPVYFTEIVITLSLAYVLFSISKISRNSKSVEEERRHTNFIGFDVNL
jgi:hypothetical protein